MFLVFFFYLLSSSSFSSFFLRGASPIPIPSLSQPRLQGNTRCSTEHAMQCTASPHATHIPIFFLFLHSLAKIVIIYWIGGGGVGLVIGQYEMELQNLSEALTSLSFCLLLTVLLSSFLEYLFLCSITRSAFDRRRRRCSLTTNSCLPCARCFRSFPPQQRGRVLVRSTLEITRPIPIHTTDRVYLCLF